ncbi:MAG: AAA family ATPase [Dehalococcoidia bacterium]
MTTDAVRLASYVPDLVQRRFTANPTPLSGPESEQFLAATCFVDISGFTALTERLTTRGPEGVEILNQILNTYFGRLILLITRYGGETVKSAGDALLAVWPVRDGEDLAGASLRAAACGLAMQAELDAYPIGAGLQLGLHIGIGAGEVHALHLGGVGNRWYFLICGTPVQQMGLAEGQATLGEVVLSPEAWALVATRCRGEPRRAGYVRLAGINLPLAISSAPVTLPSGGASPALQGYIPLPVRSRLAAGQGDWLAEFRHVSVLFINLLDFGQSTIDALAQGQVIVETVQPIVDRYEGLIKELIVDDKGAVLVAIFGLPPLAHEDDPSRCVQAALAVHAALAAAGQRSAMGITTGQAFAGPVGSDLRREYTVVGSVMNLAAHLMGKAATGILCDSATAEAAGNRLRFESLPAVAVTGRNEPVPVFQPESLDQAARHPLRRAVERSRPLVGRHAERTILREALTALGAGTNGAVIVEGEAGIGKSWLIADLVEQAEARGIRVLVGAADAIEQATPYYAWRVVVSALLGLDGLAEGDPESRLTTVRARLRDDPDLERLAPLLGDVVALGLPETELTRMMSGETRASQTQSLLVRLLDRAVAGADGSVQPLVIILEDTHWLDSASWALVRQVYEQLTPVLLILATRPLTDAAPPEYLRLRDASGARIVSLGPLQPDESVSLICNRLGVATVPEPIANLIQERAEGHPFYSEELALALRDRGLLIVEQGACRLRPEVGDLTTLRFPETMPAVITSRIDQLPPEQQLTVKVASVIGRSFAYQVLREIHPIAGDQPRLREELEELERRDLTRLSTPDPDLSYLFKHVLIQEVAYNLLPFAQRRQLHRSVAHWLEHRYAADLSPHYGLLAHHWTRAEEPAKTIDYLAPAGEQALRGGAYQEGITFLTEALRLTSAPVREIAVDAARQGLWERQLGEALYGLGRLSESRLHMERALALAGRPLSSMRLPLVVGLLGQALLQVRHRLPLCASPLSAAPPTNGTLEAVRAYGWLTRIGLLLDEPLVALSAIVRASNLADSGGPSPEQARAFAGLSMVLASVRLLPVARWYTRLALRAGRKAGDAAAVAFVYQCVGLYSAGSARWDEAERALQRASRLYGQLGNWRGQDEVHGTLALVAGQCGDYQRSLELSVAFGASARRRGDTPMEVCALIGETSSQLFLGRLDEAMHLLETATLLRSRSKDFLVNVLTDAALAVACWWRGERRPAQDAADRAVRLLEPIRLPLVTIVFAYFAVAEVYFGLWETAGSRSGSEQARLKVKAKQAARMLRGVARIFPMTEPTAECFHGLDEWLSGHPARAHRAWHEGLTAANRLRMPYEVGRAHYEIGRHLPLQDPARDRHLQRARAIYTRFGHARPLALVQEALVRREGAIPSGR